MFHLGDITPFATENDLNILAHSKDPFENFTAQIFFTNFNLNSDI